MKDKPEPDLASQMQTARELLEEGEVREALVMAMEVLWRELDQLQDTLRAVQENLPDQEIEVAEGKPAEPTISDFVWPAHNGHVLH